MSFSEAAGLLLLRSTTLPALSMMNLSAALASAQQVKAAEESLTLRRSST